MPDEAIIEHLTQVRGIGRWTVEMLLIFRIGRPDVLPVSDYGVRKGFALTFGKLKPTDKVTPADLPKPAAMEARAERWRPWRSVASWYLWRACDLAQNRLKHQP
jgi:DNA-3-methyladenine glycosylase II